MLFIWGALVAVIVIPIVLAATSPQLAWRRSAYIGAGFAGIIAMSFLLVQPLLISNLLTGLSAMRSRQIHRWTGALLVLAVVLHVAGLWITSPPDVIDVLLFRSPTPFSVWGVIAMWTVFAAALLAALQGQLRLRHRTWRIGHITLVAVTVAGSVIHALLIEGTMETVSKVILCLLVVLALVKVVVDRLR